MLSIAGACNGCSTVSVVESLSLPALLVTVSETVFAPAELKVVLYAELSPLEAPPLQA